MLHLRNALGSYPDREEFQVDRVIIWIEIPEYESRHGWLVKADDIFEKIWSAIPAIIAQVERRSRADLSSFWKEFDDGSASEKDPFIVFGIWIDPTNNSALYHVAQNYDFPWSDLSIPLRLPEDYSIMVQRNSDETIFILD